MPTALNIPKKISHDNQTKPVPILKMLLVGVEDAGKTLVAALLSGKELPPRNSLKSYGVYQAILPADKAYPSKLGLRIQDPPAVDFGFVSYQQEDIICFVFSAALHLELQKKWLKSQYQKLIKQNPQAYRALIVVAKGCSKEEISLAQRNLEDLKALLGVKSAIFIYPEVNDDNVYCPRASSPQLSGFINRVARAAYQEQAPAILNKHKLEQNFACLYEQLKLKAKNDQSFPKEQKAKLLKAATDINNKINNGLNLKLEDVEAFHKASIPFRTAWDWRVILGAVTGIIIGFVAGASAGLLLGPAATIYAAAGGAAIGGALGAKIGFWQTRGNDLYAQFEEAATKIYKLQR